MGLAVDIMRAFAVLGASSVTVAVVGFLKNVLAAYFFGTSGAMDTYLLALVIPDLTMHLAGTGAFNFIPLFASQRTRSERRAWRSAGKMLTYWLLLLGSAIALASIATEPLLRVVGPGLGPDARDATVSMTRLLLWMAAPVGAARLLAMVLYAEKRFLAGATSEVVFQVVSTLYLMVFHSWGVLALVWGQVVGGAVQLLIIGLALRNRKHQIRPDLDLRDKTVVKAIRLSLPVYVGTVTGKLNVVVGRAFASLLGVGAISSLQYATLLVESPIRILGKSMTGALFPFLSEQFIERESTKARDSVRRALVTTAVFFVPLAGFVYLEAPLLVRVLFERGSFDARSTALTEAALRILAPAIVALGLNELLVSVFHSRQEPGVPLRAGLARVVLNLALCALLSPVLGHRGIAAAATVSAFVKLGILLVYVRAMLGASRTATLIRDGTKVVAAALLALVIGALSDRLVSHLLPEISTAIAMADLALRGIVVLSSYAVFLRLLCPDELDQYRAVFRSLVTRSARAPASSMAWPRAEEIK